MELTLGCIVLLAVGGFWCLVVGGIMGYEIANWQRRAEGDRTNLKATPVPYDWAKEPDYWKA